MRIAILGAPATGKTRLARDLVRHLPQLQVTDDPPLLRALLGRRPPDGTALQALARAHQECFDLTLLTGLDLPLPEAATTHPAWAQQERDDAALRAALQQAGIAYGVVYGAGPQRLRNALRLAEPRQVSPQAGWTWGCDKCSDPACEFRLFTGLRDSRAAAHPSS